MNDAGCDAHILLTADAIYALTQSAGVSNFLRKFLEGVITYNHRETREIFIDGADIEEYSWFVN